jgi:sodium/potassium-transporting ATPase subunit alpha
VALNSGIELFQEYKTESILEGFLQLVPLQSMVIREGKPCDVNSEELVRGDLVLIREGQKVPADLRIIQCSRDLKVDNSSITGESEAQERKADESRRENPLESTNLLFSGTLVVSGEGLGIVIRVGDKSILGQIAKLTIQGEKRPSQLSREINFFVRKIAAVAVLTAAIFFIYGVVKKFGIGITFSFAIGIFTAFVPQGLPATVTLLLAMSAKRLSKKNVLVKDLQGVETLGSITLLASDKTGTLTQNKMKVVEGWCDSQKISFIHDIDMEIPEAELEGFSHLVLSCLLCSRARIIKEGEISGDATEVGLLKFAMECKKLPLDNDNNLEEIKRSFPKVFEIPFNSTNKWHLTIHQIGNGTEYLLLLKGAPERVFAKCGSYLGSEEKTPIEENFIAKFNKANSDMARSGKRVLAFAKKHIRQEEVEAIKELDPQDIKELCFMGLLGLMDPPKKGVGRAIGACNAAGIQVVMVTGDQPLTAESIARTVGIIKGLTKELAASTFKKPIEEITEKEYDAIIVHGDQLNSFSEADWDRVLAKKEIVFARTLPKQKLEIVTRFQSKGHIVGASGDGVNDAPALKKADLGISMNHTASDVSKEAANMILLDDNFVSIVAGIAEGRLIFTNLKKSIRYTLTHIMPEVVSGLIFIIFMVPLPLGALLILIYDLLIEVMPAISFSFEPPENDLMLVPPRKILTDSKSKSTNRDPESNQARRPGKIKRFFETIKSPFIQNSTGEVLVDNDLLLWCYLEGGIIESAACFAGYLIALVVLHVPLNASATTYFKVNAPDLVLTNGKIVNSLFTFIN